MVHGRQSKVPVRQGGFRTGITRACTRARARSRSSYTFQVTVKNVGTAPSPSSASLGNKALVQAMASDYPGWGNGVFLNALAPRTLPTTLDACRPSCVTPS
jgi:hypothetical protein